MPRSFLLNLYSKLSFNEIMTSDQNLTTINQKERYGRTPIMDAILRNAVNCFKLLLAHHEFDLDTRNITVTGV